jgi:long-chain acyl-CoA synthetase
MVGVPKVWETIVKGVQASFAKMTPFQKAIIDIALKWKLWCVKNHLDTPLFNTIVFDKIKKATGNRLRWAISGGGPLSGDTQLFVRAAFGAVLVQAYGLTESCATVAIQADDDFRAGVQGAPFPSVEVKLVSTPDITDKDGVPYLSTDRKDADGNPIFGRGEIFIKGANVSKGYYMMPEKTKEDYQDGWFATGDIAQWYDDGSLSIIDRKKNLVKTKGGEYVRLEAMEVVYGNGAYVDTMNGGICCYADGDLDRPVALMQLDESKALEWAKANGLKEDVEELKHNKDFEKEVMDSLLKEFNNSDLSRIEKLAGVSMLTDPWSSENGCLTAANKLQRRTVYKSFPKEFEDARKKGIFE